MSAAIDPAGPVEVVDLIAAAVRNCPAVAGLHGGRFGQTTTYLPGRRVAGVTVSDTEIAVGVIGRYPIPVAALAGQVRAAVAELARGMPVVPVTVRVEDLLLPGESLPGESLPGESLPGESLPGESLPGGELTGADPGWPAHRGGPAARASARPAPPSGAPIPARPPLATPVAAPPEKEKESP